MLNGWPAGGIWLSTQPTDMRKSFDGLSGLVRNHLRDDPLSGRWFVFINRRRTILKILALRLEASGSGASAWKGDCLPAPDLPRCARRRFRAPNFWPLSMVWT